MTKMKFLAVISSRYPLFSSVIHLIRINQCRAISDVSADVSHVTLVNGAKQRPTVERVAAVLPRLRVWLDCPQVRAKEICSQLAKQKRFDVESVEEQVDFLKQNGVSAPVILDHPWLLLQPLDDLKEKMKMLQKIGVVLGTIPLLRLPRGHLKSVVNHWLEEAETFSKEYQTPNRLQFFADRLQCSCTDVAMLMERHYYLLTMDLNRVARVMHLLLECGIPPQEIKNDLWIFSYNEGLIRERIERAREARLYPVKIWMLRCVDQTFAKKLGSWTETKKVLGTHEDVESYLAERLKCSKSDVLEFHKKYKKFSTISVLKLKSNLDFLFEIGFTPEEVREAPRVLGHSISTMAARFQELKVLKYPYINVRMLFVTAREYQRMVTKIRQDKHS